MNDTTNTKNRFVCKRNYTIQRYVGLGENSKESEYRTGKSWEVENGLKFEEKKDNNNSVVWAI